MPVIPVVIRRAAPYSTPIMVKFRVIGDKSIGRVESHSVTATKQSFMEKAQFFFYRRCGRNVKYIADFII